MVIWRVLLVPELGASFTVYVAPRELNIQEKRLDGNVDRRLQRQRKATTNRQSTREITLWTLVNAANHRHAITAHCHGITNT